MWPEACFGRQARGDFLAGRGTGKMQDKLRFSSSDLLSLYLAIAEWNLVFHLVPGCPASCHSRGEWVWQERFPQRRLQNLGTLSHPRRAGLFPILLGGGSTFNHLPPSPLPLARNSVLSTAGETGVHMGLQMQRIISQ